MFLLASHYIFPEFSQILYNNSLLPISGNAVACNLNAFLMTDVVFPAKDNSF